MNEAENKLVERLRASAEQIRAPAHLRDRIVAAIESEQRLEAVQRRRPLWYGAAATALAAVLAFMLIGVPVARNPELSVSQGLSHQAATAELADWFDAQLQYNVVIPNIENARLVSGMIRPEREELAAMITYSLQGMDVAYLMAPTVTIRDHLVQEKAGPYIVSTADSKMVVWRSIGFSRALVADLPDEELLAIAIACKRQELASPIDS